MKLTTNEKYFLLLITLISFLIKIFVTYNFNLPNFVDSQAYSKAGFEFINFFRIEKVIIMPLYSIVAYFNDKLFEFYLFNIIFSSINIYLIFLITKKIFQSNRIALISAFLMAFYPFNIFYAVTGFSETFFLTLLLLGFFFLYNEKIYLCSIFFTLSILCRPIGEIIYPIIIIFFSIFIFKYKIKLIFINIFKYLIIYIILMSPWWYHNYSKYSKFVRLNIGSSLVLYAGNNPLNKTGGGVIIDDDDLRKFPERFTKTVKDYDFEEFRNKPGFELKVDYVDLNGNLTSYKTGYKENQIDPPFGKILGKVSRIKGDKYALLREREFKASALKFIKENPLRFIKNMFQKFKKFWSITPNSHEFKNNLFYFILSSLSIFLLYFFSIIGALLDKNYKNKLLIPFFIFLIYVSFVHMITIASIRYRFILEWILIILASYTLNYFYNKIIKQ